MLIKVLSRLPASAGLTILVLLPVIVPFLGQTFLMHTGSPLHSMVFAIPILWLVSTLVGMAAWAIIPSHRLKDQLFIFGLAVALPVSLSDIFLLTGWLHVMPGRGPLLFSAIMCFLILTWVRRANAIVYRRIQQGTMVLLSGLGLWAVLIMGQLLSLNRWHTVEGEAQAGAPAAIRPAALRGRVVWILLDELAFEQTYGDRDAHLPLPHLDAFRRLSTLYTQVLPVGDRTALVVPGLLLGQKLSKVRYRTDNTLEIVPAGESAWRPYSASKSLFAEARALGYKNGIVGWYNPYCSFLAGQWDSCFWTFEEDIYGMSADAGILENTRSLAIAYLLRAIAPRVYERRSSAGGVRSREREYRALMEQARNLLSQPSFGFVFIHLAVPHPLPFYNRQTKNFGPGGSYLDSLALMDLALGNLLDEIKSSGTWPQTSVVISGDHSYRVAFWKSRPSWTMEDERATHGVFDDRPLLLIHKAGQQSPETVNTPTPLMIVHSTLEDMLRQNGVNEALRPPANVEQQGTYRRVPMARSTTPEMLDKQFMEKTDRTRFPVDGHSGGVSVRTLLEGLPF